MDDSATSDSDSDSATLTLAPATEVVIILVLSVMIVTTIVGNILVCLSVVLVKKLRHPSNYLLVSLAVSDLCVALLVMPFALYLEISPSWGLGPSLCNLWVSFDVTCCTASILNLCTISVDRYLTITRPLTYGVNATAKRSYCFIFSIWVASCLISVPPLLVFGNEHGTDELPYCQVSQNVIYQLYATVGAFYIPLSVMIVMYYKIYGAAKKVVEAELKAQPSSAGGSAVNCSQTSRRLLCRSSEQPASVTSTSESREGLGLAFFPPARTSGSTHYSPAASCEHSFAAINSFPAENHPIRAKMQRSLSLTNGREKASSVSATCERSASSDLRERKASVTLGVIMTAFTVCWLPFFILALLRPYSASRIPGWIVSFALWLGYANSMINPIIYVTFHQDFRKAFRYLLCLQCATMGTRLREEAYQSQYGCTSYSHQSHCLTSGVHLPNTANTTTSTTSTTKSSNLPPSMATRTLRVSTTTTVTTEVDVRDTLAALSPP